MWDVALIEIADATHDAMDVTQRERELGAIITAYNDVTERLKQSHESLQREVARLHGELHRTNEALRRSERLAALGEMAAGLAHEIRNPLGGIALYASMLSQAAGRDDGLVDAAQTRTAATRIAHGVRTLERLIAEILDFAQEHRLERQRCRLGTVFEALRDAMAPWEEQTGARMTIDADADEIEANVDTCRLHRVLVNLVMNGLQAAGRGGQVAIAAWRDADAAVIEVADSGPGIAEELLPRVFNPFFTTKDTGTGLGLAIVHRIIEAHEGSIVVSNRAGGGAVFALRLPDGESTDHPVSQESE